MSIIDPRSCSICGDHDDLHAAEQCERQHLAGAEEDLRNAQADLQSIRRDIREAATRRRALAEVAS